MKNNKKKPATKATKTQAKSKPAVKPTAKKITKSTVKKAVKPAAVSTPKATAKPKISDTFNHIVILASGDDLLAAEAEMRLRTVHRHQQSGKSLPPIIRVAGIPATADAMAFALYRSYRALGRNAPTLFICSGPQGGTPVLIQTDWNNTILTTQNGTLGLITTLLSQRHIPYNLNALNTDLLEQLEQRRMNNPEYVAADDFLLRDILAPAAALLLSGTSAKGLLATGATRTRASGHPSPSPFQAGVKTAMSGLGKPQTFTALKQPDGRFLTNLTLDPLSFDQWRDDHGQFTLALGGSQGFLKLPKAKEVSVAGAQEPQETPVSLHLSPHWAPVWDERFLSLDFHSGSPAEDILTGTLTRHR